MLWVAGFRPGASGGGVLTDAHPTRTALLPPPGPATPGKALQRTGMLTKDQLTMFFQRSKEQFMNPEFKLLLRAAHKHGRSTEESINGMQQQVFQAMGVQGDFGISCLARVTQVHNDDAFFIRSFFEFVQLEEQTLDEADMEEEAYRAKYRHLNQVKARMEAQMQKMEVGGVMPHVPPQAHAMRHAPNGACMPCHAMQPHACAIHGMYRTFCAHCIKMSGARAAGLKPPPPAGPPVPPPAQPARAEGPCTARTQRACMQLHELILTLKDVKSSVAALCRACRPRSSSASWQKCSRT